MKLGSDAHESFKEQELEGEEANQVALVVEWCDTLEPTDHQ